MSSVTRDAAPWLDIGVGEIERAIVKRALADVGIVEMPLGSNRSERIDEYVTAVGSPLGSRWCAAAVAAWWRESGAEIPEHDGGSCNEWMEWSRDSARWNRAPSIAAAVVYGAHGVASHIGVIVRTTPLLLSVEGNTSLSGAFDPDGVAVALKETNIARVLGYITPVAGEKSSSNF